MRGADGACPYFPPIAKQIFFCSGLGSVLVVDAFNAEMVNFTLKMLYFELRGLKIPMESKICQNYIQNILRLTAQPQDVWMF